MKHILLALLLLGIAHILPAQNWAPVNTTDIYNYKADTASAISHSLWVDSVGFDGVDSVYYPNRIVKNYPNGPGDFYGIALKNQPQFLNKQVTLQANGLYLYTDPTVISYYSLAALNDTYTYDSTNNITATVVAIDEDTILGNVDSIKTILLSSGDTIIASKNHGFVQYPIEYGSGKYYRLAGIEGGRSLGEHVAKFDDFFNYSIGDTFWYYTEEFVSDGATYYYTLKRKNVYSIDTILRSGDTITYNFPNATRFYGGYNIDLPGNDVNDYPNTVTEHPHPFITPDSLFPSYSYDIPPMGFDNSLMIPTCFPSNGHALTDLKGHNPYKTNDGKRVKEFSYFYCHNAGRGDTLQFQIHHIDPSTYTHRVFVERLGLVQMEMHGFESYSLYVVYAYRLSGDTAITILDQDLFDLVIGIDEEPSSATNFKLLGNPVTHTLALQLETAEPHIITLYNLSGQQILQQQVQATNVTMDVAHLPQGVYLLEVSTPTGIGRQRVVKL